MTQDFDDFEVVVASKPEAGVTVGVLPPKLVECLDANFKEALDDDNKELLLKAKDNKQAKLLASYARAWGARQEPKLRVTKLPNGNRYPDNIARLQVVLDSDVPAEARPGRRKS